MANTLVSQNDLIDFPGAPFNDYLLDVAVAALRADAGWHIAPVLTETLTVDSYGGSLLILPTRRIVSVSAVRDAGGALGSWTRMAGGIYRRSGWPVGVVEVDLTHGYASTPLDLLPIVVDYVRKAGSPRDLSLASRTSAAGIFTESESYRDGAPAISPTLARYAVPAGVA